MPTTPPLNLKSLSVTVMEARVNMDTSGRNWQTRTFNAWEELPDLLPAAFGGEVSRRDNSLPLRQLITDLCTARTPAVEFHEPYTDYADGQTGVGSQVIRRVTVSLEFRAAVSADVA